ncbi:MAG: Rrf2 family transcriptional regulator [bacterium]
MKFSIKVQYGLQAVMELALNYGGGPVQIKDIAKSQKIPIRFLEQLMLHLKRSGLVSSLRGKDGGYLLAKRPSEITLYKVVEALDGPIELGNKKMKKFPIVLEIFEEVQSSLIKQLSALTLDEIVMKKRQTDLAINYSI